MSSSEKTDSEKIKQLQEHLSYLRWLGLMIACATLER